MTAKLLTSVKTNKQAGGATAPGGRAADQPPHTLKISIAHGDLRRARYPLAVGHYHGDTIVHAERRLDEQLGGRLTEFFNMYLYPGPAGTVEVLHAPDSSPPGALVIGLGDVGEIKPSVVRAGITNAALRHALAVLNRSRSAGASAGGSDGGQTWLPAGFSTLLLGTYGGNALSIEASLSTIVQGAIQANEALRAQGLWDKVRIDEVQVVELYEDVALEATRVAVYLAEHPPTYLTAGDELQVLPPYLFPLGNGRSQRPVDPYTRGWWRRIQITRDDGKDGAEGLHFLALTDRARAEDTLQHAQLKFIEKAIEKAVSSPSFTEELSTMLFKLLIPNSIKEQTSSETDLVLVVDAGAAQYPWELLADRTRNGVEPLAIRMGLVRQFKTAKFTLSPQPARERNALVVGVPKSGEIDLPGARNEAKQVAEVLQEAGYDVGGGALNDAGPLEVMGRLFAKGYKILHLAGHGNYVPGNPDRSGMILDEGMYLTPKEIRNLTPLPELVFINCCYLGRIDEKEAPPTASAPHSLAASISEELINMGVKAIVAAGWAVEDKAAAAFAGTFYREMLRGEKFGMSVLAARIAAQKASPHSNTWGAYQCYGNPDFVLERSGDGSESAQPQQNRCYSRRDYLERLADIQSDAARADAGSRDSLRLQLEGLGKDIPPIWSDGAVLRAFGAAWAALGYFDKAIESYLRAAREEKAEAPLNTIEQLANLLVRYADILRARQRDGAQNGAGAATTHDPDALTDDAIKHLKWLLELGESGERLSLMGRCYKGKAAAATTPGERREYLELAASYYGRAHAFMNKAGVTDPYPTLNWLTYRFLLGETFDKDFALLEASKEAARKADESEPSFWNRVTEPDAELLRHLTLGDLEENLPGVTALYRRAIRTGVTRRELSTVVQHFVFLREMLSGLDEQGTAAARNIRSLEELRATFDAESRKG